MGKLRKVAAVALAAGLSAACAPDEQNADAWSGELASSDATSARGYANRLEECLHYVNISRGNAGRNGLGPSYGLQGVPYGAAIPESFGRLQKAAFYHARDMAERGYFSHVTPE